MNPSFSLCFRAGSYKWLWPFIYLLHSAINLKDYNDSHCILIYCWPWGCIRSRIKYPCYYVRSEPLDFSLQVDSPRYRTDRALALEVRYLRKDLRYENRALLVARSQTKRAKLSRSDFWQPGERDSSIEGSSVANTQWRLKARGSLRISIPIKQRLKLWDVSF